MPAEIVTVGFCPQYLSRWHVLSSGVSTKWYDVTLNGVEAAPHCSCPAFKYSGPFGDQDCKHLQLVWKHGCLWNPQWKDAGPNDYAAFGIELVETDVRNRRDDQCPGCGQLTISVRIAV